MSDTPRAFPRHATILDGNHDSDPVMRSPFLLLLGTTLLLGACKDKAPPDYASIPKPLVYHIDMGHTRKSYADRFLSGFRTWTDKDGVVDIAGYKAELAPRRLVINSRGFEILTKFDLDKDGRLARAEADQIFAKAGLLDWGDAGHDKRLGADFLMSSDLDKDGFVTPADVVAGLAIIDGRDGDMAVLESPVFQKVQVKFLDVEEYALRFFDMADVDGDEKISKGEREALYAQTGVPPLLPERFTLFSVWGKVSETEFGKSLGPLPTPLPSKGS